MKSSERAKQLYVTSEMPEGISIFSRVERLMMITTTAVELLQQYVHVPGYRFSKHRHLLLITGNTPGYSNGTAQRRPYVNDTGTPGISVHVYSYGRTRSRRELRLVVWLLLRTYQV